MSDEPHGERLFTVEEANALLPDLTDDLPDIPEDAEP